jgi:endonuclease-3
MPKTQTNDQSQRMKHLLRWLRKAYPAAHCALHHTNPLELLIATMLSAQCTDERVNLVTADLFRKYRTAEDYVNVERAELERDIHSTGFFRNKAKNIQGACQIISEQYQGRVPETMEELLALPGVARKTANVVLGNAFGLASGIVVDTHVSRLAQRLGLTNKEQPEKIEQDLIAMTPQQDWIDLSHLLIAHGRAVCQARKPNCAACPLESLCPSSSLRR